MKIEKTYMISKATADHTKIYSTWHDAVRACKAAISEGGDDMHIVKLINSKRKRVGYALECWYGLEG